MANIFDLMEEYCAANNGTNAALKEAKGAVSWGIKSGLITVTAPEHGADYWLSQKRRQRDKDWRKLAKVERLKLKILALEGKL